MAIRKPKPTSPGVRFVSYPDFAEITRSEPERSLTEGLKKSGGRNALGRKTSRHRGGGAKRLYRTIDFKRRKDGIPARVAQIEYDPNARAPARRSDGPVGPRRRHPRRQLPAAGEHARGHRGPQRRAHPRPRRP